MARHFAYVGALVIPNGTNASNTLTVPNGKMAISFTFVAPATLTNTITLQGALGAETPQSISINGTTQTLAAAVTRRVDIGGLIALKLSAGGNEGGARTFQVYAEFDT